MLFAESNISHWKLKPVTLLAESYVSVNEAQKRSVLYIALVESGSAAFGDGTTPLKSQALSTVWPLGPLHKTW